MASSSHMKHAIPLLVLLLVSILAVAAVNAQQPTQTTAGKTREHGRTTPAPRETDANAKGQEGRRPGGFNQTGGAVEGRYVSFQLDLEACTLTDYAVYGTVFFDAIQLSVEDCSLAKGSGRARMELGNREARIGIHDAPNAVLRIELQENVSAAMMVNPGIRVNETAKHLELSAGNLTARVFTTRSANNPAMDWTAPTITIAGADVDVLFHPAAGNTAERRAILDAISRGKVGAQVDVLAGLGGAQGEVIAFDEVEIRVRQSGKDRFDFIVAANLTEGRIVLVNFDPEAWDPQRLRVDYADVTAQGARRPVRIVAADSLQQVLDFESGGDPLYYVYEDAEGRHVAVAVPEFSVHAFEVVGIPLQVVPLLMYGIVIVGLFFATGGVGVVLERRARRQRDR